LTASNGDLEFSRMLFLTLNGTVGIVVALSVLPFFGENGFNVQLSEFSSRVCACDKLFLLGFSMTGKK